MLMFPGSLVLLVAVSAWLDPRNKISPVARPLYYGASMLGVGVCLGTNCGVGLNPARDLAPRLLTSLLGWGLEVMTVSGYWSLLSILASHAGGITGVWLYRALTGARQPGGSPAPPPRKEFRHHTNTGPGTGAGVQINGKTREGQQGSRTSLTQPDCAGQISETASLQNLFTEDSEVLSSSIMQTKIVFLGPTLTDKQLRL